MPDLLGVTNPVPGHETQTNRVTPPTPNNSQNIQNVVDPTRVVRPDGRNEQKNAGDSSNSYGMRYESNFMSFLQRLKNSPQLTQTFYHLMQSSGMRVTSGVSEGLAKEMSEFLEFLQMDEQQLLSFLKNQLQSGSRFTGPLFQSLRNAYNNANSTLLQNDILQFLRRFSDYSSTDHLQNSILRNLFDMGRSLPSKWADQLFDLGAQLENGMVAGDRAGNLQILQNQIIPLIAKYVSQTHDHGRARGLLSMLTLDLVRYGNGSEEGLLSAFRHLSASGALPGNLNNLSDQQILQLLQESQFFKAAQANQFANHMASIAHRALNGEGGNNAQEAFQNILSSLLLNESVYMPLNHVMLPLNWNGKLMYSEMWVDPDADKTREEAGGGKTLRILIKMDIQDLGAFDLLMNVQNDAVSLHIACPQTVSAFSGTVTKTLSEILERNGLRANDVQIGTMQRPVAISDVFPKLFERKGGVNVTI